MSTLVTLTTDFGARDPYVASMKGVLFQTCAGIQVIDLSHDISPQDVLEGSLFWAGAIPYFPPGGIHVGVIDPGVGTARLPIVAVAQGHRFVCPDNGLLTLFLREHPLDEARVISNPEFMRAKISATLHGRDVFAPTAARLALGVPLHEVGESLDTLVSLDVPEPSGDKAAIAGQVIHIDRFGNAITNIPRTLLGNKKPREIRFGDHTLKGLCNTYADVPFDKPLALFGSAEYLEVAVNGGSAGIALGLRRGDEVHVLF